MSAPEISHDPQPNAIGALYAVAHRLQDAIHGEAETSAKIECIVGNGATKLEYVLRVGPVHGPSPWPYHVIIGDRLEPLLEKCWPILPPSK